VGIEGVVVGGAGTTGLAAIAKDGQASLIFDGPTTAGDYVVQSTTLVGQGHDAGVVCRSASQVVGRVLSTNGSGGTFAIIVGTEGCGGSSGSPPAGASQLQTSNSGGTTYLMKILSSIALSLALTCTDADRGNHRVARSVDHRDGVGVGIPHIHTRPIRSGRDFSGADAARSANFRARARNLRFLKFMMQNPNAS
jgi:hypothetical protein